MTLMLTYEGPLRKYKIESENRNRCPRPNIARIYALHRHKQKEDIKEKVQWHILAKLAPEPPITVTLTRISHGTLDDHDNLQASLKHVADAVAKAYGIDDADRRKVKWKYAQRDGGAKWYGVEIKLESRKR